MGFEGHGASWFEFRTAHAADNLMEGRGGNRSRQPLNNISSEEFATANALHDEARSSERSRLAQELHDTLLQGFYAVSMQLHVAVDQLQIDVPGKQRFSSLLNSMDRVLEEGRRAVQGLRSSPSNSPSLPQRLAAIPGELGFPTTIHFEVEVLGRPQRLNEWIHQELYRIAREAIVNAVRHSQGNSIRVQIAFRTSEISVTVRDNGNGIDARVLRSGRAGHWGLSGMKERAQRIGGELKILSRGGVGTQVTVTVDGCVAFDELRMETARSSARTPAMALDSRGPMMRNLEAGAIHE
jgi:signal transduction histidine kinase